MNNYSHIVLYIIVIFIISSSLIILSHIIAKYIKLNEFNKNKTSAFECGFDAFEDTREKFNVKFYLIAILFILFDIEIAFVLPWAIVIKKISLCGFLSMGSFMLLLILGFIYEWKKGALEWE